MKFTAYYKDNTYEIGDSVRDENEMAMVVEAPNYETAEAAFKSAIENMLSGVRITDEELAEALKIVVKDAKTDFNYTYNKGEGFRKYDYSDFGVDVINAADEKHKTERPSGLDDR